MYRDDAIDLDEHDRAVGAILIGEALIAECDAKTGLDKGDPKRWRAMRDLHDDYPEVWRQLDRAKQILDKRGANTMGYEELRTHVKPTIVVSGKDDDQQVDRDALDDARRAIGELKLAVPGTDWKAITKRTNELAATPRLRKPHRLLASMLVCGFVLGIAAWFFAIKPEKKIDQREVMRQEIADVAAHRVQRVERLGLVINNICDPSTAHEYIKLLVLDGRKDQSVAFHEDYTARCGEDRVVENWARAPRPKARSTKPRVWHLPVEAR
ncbi:MAG: hypothetical protein ACKV2T_41565 [Kofleriaceae bacterium]